MRSIGTKAAGCMNLMFKLLTPSWTHLTSLRLQPEEGATKRCYLRAMRILFAVVLVMNVFCVKAQTAVFAAVDSILLLPFPGDSLRFSCSAFVEVNGTVGQLLMNDSAWAWNEDTALVSLWDMQLEPSGPLMHIDLESKRGTLEQWPARPVQPSQWMPTGMEDRKLGLRSRMFSSDGDTLWVVAQVDFPHEKQLLAWHRVSFPLWNPLDRMPRKVTPVALMSSASKGWIIKEFTNESTLLVLTDVLLFDPNRTFMDVVREQRGQR